jgi:exosortase/archaeosortase family protein
MAWMLKRGNERNEKGKQMYSFLWRYALVVLVGLSALELEIIKLLIEKFCEGLALISGYSIQLIDNNIILESPNILRHKINGFAIAVSNECSGLSAVVLLSAAILVFPASRQSKLMGIFAGFILIQIVNIFRLISLVYAGGFLPDHFDTIHYHLFPFLLHFVVLLLFSSWLIFKDKNYAI